MGRDGTTLAVHSQERRVLAAKMPVLSRVSVVDELCAIVRIVCMLVLAVRVGRRRDSLVPSCARRACVDWSACTRRT